MYSNFSPAFYGELLRIETVLKTEMYNLFAMPLNYFLLREGKEKRGVEEQKTWQHQLKDKFKAR